MSRDKIKSKFLRSVSKNIRCRNQDKKPYLEFLSKQVDDFLEENEAADYVQLCGALGEPEKIALEFSEELSDAQLKKYDNKKIVIKVIVAVLLVSLFIGFYWYIMYGIERIEYIVESPLYIYVENEEDLTSEHNDIEEYFDIDVKDK